MTVIMSRLSPRLPPRSPVLLVPARMASTRLPGKPLADIHGLPMIVHVMKRAEEARLGPVVVACSEPEVAEAVKKAGGNAILTPPDLPSGSDRIHMALQVFDPEGQHDAIINVQGDVPTVHPETIRAVHDLLQNPEVDVSTAIAPITTQEERDNPAVVKAVVELAPGAKAGRALYFSRNLVPANEGPYWHHIGIYGYRREALARFVSLPPAELEKREKLEQIRVLANGMRLDAAVVSEVPLGVDTPADLEKARSLL